jgi:hypothetical protein
MPRNPETWPKPKQETQKKYFVITIELENNPPDFIDIKKVNKERGIADKGNFINFIHHSLKPLELKFINNKKFSIIITDSKKEEAIEYFEKIDGLKIKSIRRKIDLKFIKKITENSNKNEYIEEIKKQITDNLENYQIIIHSQEIITLEEKNIVENDYRLVAFIKNNINNVENYRRLVAFIKNNINNFEIITYQSGVITLRIPKNNNQLISTLHETLLH